MTDLSSSSSAVNTNKIHFNIPKRVDTFPEWYDRILVITDIVDKKYPVKGMPIMRPYGWFMHRQVMKALEAQLDRHGAQQLQFPLLIPDTYLLKEAEHVEGFSAEVFWVKMASKRVLEVPLALRPTSETAMYSSFKEWIRAYTDLPLRVYQTCPVYRYETKSTLPLIRAREIHWNECHTMHEGKGEAIAELETAFRIYWQLIQGTLGFTGLQLRRPKWDTFAGAEWTEVIDTIMPSGKVLQVAGAHFLGQKFSQAFDIVFQDAESYLRNPYMTCFGVSTRLLASAISLHGDDKGLVLPSQIAQIQVVLVPIFIKGKIDEVQTTCERVARVLETWGIRVYLDDNRSKSPGEKFYFWEMKGIPVRLEIGPRDLKKGVVTAVMRGNGQKYEIVMQHTAREVDAVTVVQEAAAEEAVAVQEAVAAEVDRCFVGRVKDLLASQDAELLSRATEFHKNSIQTICSLEDLMCFFDKENTGTAVEADTDADTDADTEMDKTDSSVKGFARVAINWNRGEEIEGTLKELFTGVEIRGTRPEESGPNESVSDESCPQITCFFTGDPATHWAYIARSY